MTSINSVLLKQAKTSKALKDQSDTSSAQFSDNLPEIGKAPARLVGYVELGLQAQPAFKGKAKDPARELIISFEIFGSKNTREIEVDGKKKKVGKRLDVRVTEKLNDRAKFTKLFTKMTRSCPIEHIAHMLNEVFLVEIRHVESAKGRKYATIQAEDGSFNVSGPTIEKLDDMGEVIGEIDLVAITPPASVPFRLFLNDDPTLEQWQSIKIDGTYTKKTTAEDGSVVEEEKSKNFMQEAIMSALDWEGSAMEALLNDLGEEEIEEEVSEEEEEFEEVEEIEEIEEEEEEAPPALLPKKATVAKKSVPASASTVAKASTTGKASATTATKSPSNTVSKKPTPAKKSVDKQVDDDLAAMGL